MKQKTTFLKTICMAAVFLFACNILSAQTPVAHYKFDGNLNDEGGTWNLIPSEFTDGGGITTTYTPTYGQDRNLNSNSTITDFYNATDNFNKNYVTTSADFTPLTSASNLTITTWIYNDHLVNRRCIAGLGLNDNSAPNQMFSFMSTVNDSGGNDGKHQLGLQIGGANNGGTEVLSDATLTNQMDDQTWYHVAVVYSDNGDTTGDVKFFINGVDQTGTTLTIPALNIAASPLRVGNDFQQATGNRSFRGAIDDFMLYDAALTESQVQTIYINGTLSTEKNSLEASFSAYPNPVQDRIYFSTNDVVSVEVYNLLGSKVGTQKVADSSIDMSNLSNGIYILKCQDAEGANLGSVKAVKQ